MKTVSFEVALLLRAANYNERCRRHYVIEGTDHYLEGSVVCHCNEDLLASEVSAPTPWDAMAWLREKHNIVIYWVPFLNPLGNLSYYVDVCQIDGRQMKQYGAHNRNFSMYVEDGVEDALAWCLKELLKVELPKEVDDLIDEPRHGMVMDLETYVALPEVRYFEAPEE